MLLSTARGLAEEIGCFDEATYTTVASGESAGISSDTIEWNRTLSIFIHLADENLSLRLGYNSVNGPQYQHHDFKDFLPQHLAASDFWESTLELADIMAMTRGLLRATQKQMSDSQVNDTVTTLRRIGRALERWKRRYDFDYSGEYLLSFIVQKWFLTNCSRREIFSTCGMPDTGVSLYSTCL